MSVDNSEAAALHDIDLNRFYKIYNTVHEMLADRGYKPLKKKLNKQRWISKFLGYLAELEDPSSELDIFGVIDNMTLLFKRGKKRLLVYFYPLNLKLCQNDMNYIHTLMNEKTAEHLIIIANGKPTPKVASVLNILGHFAQFFSENELVFNITKHQLVPKYRLLEGTEREKVLKEYAVLPDGKVHLDVIPAMFTTDPIAKYYNYMIDDLVEIEYLRTDGYYDLGYRVITPPVTEKDKKGQ